MKSITIGFLGFGTVASGALRILQEHSEIAQRLPITLQVKAICSPNIHKRDSSWLSSEIIRTTDAQQILNDPDIDIVVEAIGGEEPAHSYLRQALSQGKSVVTANKLLLARYGDSLAQLAYEHKASLGIEASVAGGIPIINALREGLAGEKIIALHAILNGTTNFILTEMEKSGQSFAEILAQAQALGYAEADPRLDIEGLDARDKLAILTMLCFGQRPQLTDITTQGITQIRPVDFIYAAHLDSTIRLLCTAEQQAGQLSLSVYPTLIPYNSMLAKVDGCFNAILVTGQAGGPTLYFGRGAGSGPTGIAIVSDIMRIAQAQAQGQVLPSPLGLSVLTAANIASPQQSSHPYALRFIAQARTGVIAKLAAILADHQININSVLQEQSYDKEGWPFLINIEPTTIAQLTLALDSMKALEFLVTSPLALRIEKLAHY